MCGCITGATLTDRQQLLFNLKLKVHQTIYTFFLKLLIVRDIEKKKILPHLLLFMAFPHYSLHDVLILELDETKSERLLKVKHNYK